MNRISRVLIGLTLVCLACTKTEKETPSGLKFTVIKAGDGVVPKKEEIIIFEYLLRDSKDSVWSDTYSQGFPVAIPIADSSAISSEKGMFQMFRMLSKGDSVKVTMPISTFFQDVAGGPLPPNVDSTLRMSYFIQVKEILKQEEFQQYQMALMEKTRKTQIAKESNAIAKYLTEKNIKAEKDSSGLMYVIHTSKGGPRPSVDNCVEVSYRGALLEDGQVFDQQAKYAFPLNRVIRGWQLAIPMLGIGDSATFFIPSGLAYGPQGIQGTIPPNAILVFDVALLGIGNNFDNATGQCN